MSARKKKISTSGFVYIWRDRKHKRYYVGSHWGAEDDGYICSSKWMSMSRLRRPQDFKRRIVKVVSTNRKDLLEEEMRWLSMIKPEELGKRYYNLKIWDHTWLGDDERALTVAEKIARTKRSRSPEEKAATSAKMRESRAAFFARGGQIHNKGKSGPPITDETRAKRSAGLKAAWASGEFTGTKGTHRSRESNDKLRRWAADHPQRHASETIEYIRAKVLERPIVTCPHCGVAGRVGNIHRWHFDNCRTINTTSF